MYDKFDRFIGV